MAFSVSFGFDEFSFNSVQFMNPCSLSRWCHPTISSSVVPFSCPQSFPASGSFQMSQLFPSGGQSIGVSASTSDLPMNTQDWSPLGWTGFGWTLGVGSWWWIGRPGMLRFMGLQRVRHDWATELNWTEGKHTTVQKHQFFGAQLSSQSNSHIHMWPLEKP